MKSDTRLSTSDFTVPLLFITGLLSALLGQAQNDISNPWRLARIVPWWLLAAMLFGLLIVYQERAELLLRWFGGSVRRFQQTLIVGLAILCIGWSLLLIVDKETQGNLNYRDVFAFWLVAVLLLLSAVWHRPRFAVRAFVREHRTDLLIIAGFTILAALLRFVTLGTRPDVLGGDEGLFGNAGVSVYEGVHENPFGTFFGAGNLLLHEIGALMRIFGVDMFGLRIISAITGTLAAPVLYALARELAGRRIAIIAAWVMTVSHFHIHFSRMVAVTYIQGTFYAALTMYLLITGLRRKSYLRLALSATILAIYFLTYLDSRVMIGVVLASVLALFVVERPLVKGNLRALLLYALVFVVVAAPMLLWAVRHPELFNQRIEQAGTFEGGVLETRVAATGREPLGLIFDSVAAVFITLISGPLPEFYYTDMPVLLTICSILFIFGLIYSLLHIRRSVFLLLNIWLWAGIGAFGVLTLDLFSAGYRLLFVFPPVCILIGVGFERLLALLRLPDRAALRVMLVTGVAISSLNLYSYFGGYLPTCRYGGDYATRLNSRLGTYLGTLDPNTYVYLLTDGRIEAGTHPSLKFLSKRKTIENVRDPIYGLTFDIQSPTVFVAIWDRRGEVESLQAIYPEGQWDFIFDCGIQAELVAYYVSRPPETTGALSPSDAARLH
jgi:hypothetical protein